MLDFPIFNRTLILQNKCLKIKIFLFATSRKMINLLVVRHFFRNTLKLVSIFLGFSMLLGDPNLRILSARHL
jgi:hypothetical protein